MTFILCFEARYCLQHIALPLREDYKRRNKKLDDFSKNSLRLGKNFKVAGKVFGKKKFLL
jgi:hypothetical protein